MLSVLESSGRSPEQLGRILGISGMTLRRWKTAEPSLKVPKAYESTVVEGVYQLIIEGHLDPQNDGVQALLRTTTSLSMSAAMKNMGVSLEELDANGTQQDRMTDFLGRIGLAENHRTEVDGGREKLTGFKKLGEDWKRLITSLMSVIRSHEFSVTEKLVAYGALFYLICPFDLIPDHIPVFGMMDDFAVLTIASGFYGRIAGSRILDEKD